MVIWIAKTKLPKMILAKKCLWLTYKGSEGEAKAKKKHSVVTSRIHTVRMRRNRWPWHARTHTRMHARCVRHFKVLICLPGFSCFAQIREKMHPIRKFVAISGPADTCQPTGINQTHAERDWIAMECHTETYIYIHYISFCTRTVCRHSPKDNGSTIQHGAAI